MNTELAIKCTFFNNVEGLRNFLKLAEGFSTPEMLQLGYKVLAEMEAEAEECKARLAAIANGR